MLIASRCVQGAFAALLVSSTKSLLVSVYADEHTRSRAIGIFTATLTGGLAFGLILGGVIATWLGWRWCLYFNVALSLVPIIGAPRVLPSLAPRRDARIDFQSALLASGGMLGLVCGLAEAASAGWHSATVVGSLVAGAALLTLFVVRQARRSNALLPLRILHDRNRGGGLIAMVVNSLSTVGMVLILTFELQSVMHYSPLRTGLSLIPFALSAIVGSAFVAPRLVRTVSARWLVTAGILLSAGGLIPLFWLSPNSHYVPIVLFAEIIEGFGTGVGGPVILQTALRGVQPADTGAASAASSAAGQLGSSIGSALLNTIAASATSAYLVVHGSSATLAGIVHGYSVSMLWGAIILGVAALPIVLLINANPPRINPPATAG
jgi:predicted MFS family arabinose efflux permease